MELDLEGKSYGRDVSIYEEPALNSWGGWPQCFYQLQNGNWNKIKTVNSRGMAEQLTPHRKEKEHLFPIGINNWILSWSTALCSSPKSTREVYLEMWLFELILCNRQMAKAGKAGYVLGYRELSKYRVNYHSDKQDSGGTIRPGWHI